MTITQKTQKVKPRRGLCMAAGGVIDPNGNDYDAINAEKTARWAVEDAAKEGLRGPHNDYLGTSPALPVQGAPAAPEPVASAPVETDFGQDLTARQGRMDGLRSRLNGMEAFGRGNSLMGASSSIGFEAGGVVDPLAAAKAQSDAILAKYGVSGAAPAPAPVQAAPAPVQAAPAVPTGIRGWAVRNIPAAATLLNRGRQLDDEVNPAANPSGKRGALPAAPGAAHGAVGVDGVIRGPGTAQSDSIPARIGGTEFNVANGEKLAILPAKVAKNPEALNQIEEIIEGETGKPVNRGLRSGGGYVDGLIDDEVRQRASMARQQVPTAGPAPAAPMMQPLEMPAAQPAPAAARTGIAGQFDKAKAAASGIVDKAKSFTGGGAEATKQAAKGIKWYQPSPGVQALGKVAGAAGKLATPIAMADTAAEGFSTPTEEYARRTGENAGESTLKDIGIRGAGIMADLGNKLTFGVADRVGNAIAGNGFGHSNAYGEHAPATPKAAPAAPAPAPAGGTQVGNPATAEAANPNIAALREAGVQGDTGAKPEWKQDGAGRSYQSTPARGIRQIATANGDVYAGRDAKGQLNITSNMGQSPAEGEAARAKEATRMQADMQRQKDYFASAAIDSDLNSNFAPDRARGLAAQAKRAQEQATATNARKLDIDARGQDIQLLDHQLDTQAKMATLQNTRQQQNLENNTKLIDSLMGGQTIKGPDGKDVPNTEREAFLTKLTKTLGEGGKTLGHMAPQDFVSFHNAYQADKNGKGGVFEKLYKNWIDGHPEVDDYNPYRNTERADGDAGKSNSLKYYRNRNGVLVNERDVTGREFGTGSYDSNIKRQIDNR